jgi:nucleotide-binding universal stress UspA family protein
MKKSLRRITMLKILLPVDGSKSSSRAASKLLETSSWYRSRPRVELLAVHLPVPRFTNMSTVISTEMINRYYRDECTAMLKPGRRILDRAGMKYNAQMSVGPIAETIVAHARECGADMIYMGSRGMTALAGMVLGSVTTRVLHLATIPVLLVH